MRDGRPAAMAVKLATLLYPRQRPALTAPRRWRYRFAGLALRHRDPTLRSAAASRQTADSRPSASSWAGSQASGCLPGATCRRTSPVEPWSRLMRFVERRPILSLVVLLATVLCLWLFLAAWPQALE